MINTEEFYAMIPGAIGTVSYKWNGGSQMTNHEEQEFIDNYSREAMHVLLNKAKYSYEEIQHPYLVHFQSRQDARNILDKMGPSIELKNLEIQIGNQECLSEIIKIETNKDFNGWVNTELIQIYISESKRYLQSST